MLLTEFAMKLDSTPSHAELRGGRMTKVNGEAASYADEAGFARIASTVLNGVSALAAAVSPLLWQEH